MAGQPWTLERLAMLDANADIILEWLSEGASMQTISVRISDKLQVTIPHTLVGRWTQSEKWAPEVARSRARAADSFAENVVDRADMLARDVAIGAKGRDDIAAERHLADSKKWIAGIWNQKYAPQTAASVTVNVGAVHLDSLRTMALPAKPDALDVEFRELPAKPLALDDLL